MALGISIGERIGDEEEARRRAMENATDNVRVAMPGKIADFDSKAQTATILPLIREYIRGEWVEFPPLLDVPCFFPRAGGYCLTFPVKKGDECLVIFNDMCIDAWWQSGDVQNQLEARRHDLSDAMALLGITSVPQAVKDYSVNSVRLRNEDNDSYFEIVDDTKTINISGAENIHIQSEKAVNINATSDIDIKSSANININGSGNIAINSVADITISAQGNLTLLSNGAMDINSNTSITLNAPQITQNLT